MKRITLYVEETATYKRTYEVEDNFDVGNPEALESLWCNDPEAVTKGCQTVDDRHIRVIANEDIDSLF